MILKSLGDLLWILLFFPLFAICSLYLIPGLGRLLAVRIREGKNKTLGNRGSLNGFQAAATTLAATVGTGNIIGTAQAIAMGGPGAVVWLWVAAVLGFSVKSAEIWFGQRTGKGAPGTISAAMGTHWAGLYALTAVLSTLSVGNMAQMNTIVSSLAARPGEGDVPALLSMMISHALTGVSGFQANPAQIDVETGRILFAHCTIPFNMVENWQFDTHFDIPTMKNCRRILRMRSWPRKTRDSMSIAE